MKLSIVTISFNQGLYLSRCIDSVLEQKGVDYEYIVVDPGSSDRSREIINSYGDKIIKVFKADNGPAQGLNNGFKVASGDIFGFINADDYYLPNAFKEIDFYYRKPPYDFFITGAGFIESDNSYRKIVRPTKLSKKDLLLGACMLFQPGTFFPAFMYHAVGGFNEENHGCWDYELFVDFLNHNFAHIVTDKFLSVFSVHSKSITGSGMMALKNKLERQRIFCKSMGRKITIVDQINSLWLRSKHKLLNL